jgi:hypothetical protein
MNRRFAVILGLVTASCAASALVACSGDDSGTGSGGQDAASDHASGDSTTPDANPGMDGSTQDSTTTETGSDGGPEGSVAEGGGEGGTEGGSDGGSDAGDAGSDASEGGACALFDAGGLDEASVQAGFVQVWQVYKCWRCHQNPTSLVDDAGNGILLNGNTVGLGDSGTIFPPNLTNSAQGLGCWTDPQIATAILQGHDPEGGTLCPPMPVFDVGDGSAGKPMDAGTAQEIIDYIRSLTPSAQTTPDTTCNPPADGGSDAPEDAPDAG